MKGDRDDESSSSSFPRGETAQEKGLSHVPDCYMIPTSHRPSLNPKPADVSLIDLSGLRGDSSRRCATVLDIKNACCRYGFFQIINHGIDQSVVDEALGAASDFFNLPTKEKAKFMSNDVHKPIRYGTSLKDGAEKIQFWRIFLKHYAHPLEEWVKIWPQNPPAYREKLGRFAVEVRKLALEIAGAIAESLGIISPQHLGDKMERGMQVMAVNWYPPCPQPSLALGLPPHSDYSCFTILSQTSPGLEIWDPHDEGSWRLVPQVKGALQVQVGDHFEVLSNGIYKSAVHRATLSRERTRISIASLHSLGLDEKMEPANELVDEKHPKGYRESSFRDFLNFLEKNDLAQGKSFIETLKIRR